MPDHAGGDVEPQRQDELARCQQVLCADRAQDRRTCGTVLETLVERVAKKVLYRLCARRLASMKLLPKSLDWNGATRFDSN